MSILPNINSVDIMTNLRLRSGSAGATGPAPSTITLDGYYSPGDGGGGTFAWIHTNSLPTDNGGTIIVPSTNPSPTGYWQRVFSGPHNVKWFGAKGDGSTDDAAAINGTVNAAVTAGGAGIGGQVYLPPTSVSYRVGSPILLYPSIRISGGAGGASPVFQGTLITSLPTFAGDAVFRLATRVTNSSTSWGIIIENLSITLESPICGIDVSGMINFTIERVEVRCVSGFIVGSTGFLLSDSDTFQSSITSPSNNQVLPQSTINVASTTGWPSTGTADVLSQLSTTVAAGSDGVVLPTSTIQVASTTNFPSRGYFLVTTSGGPQVVWYSGKTLTAFTGCLTNDTDTLHTGQAISALVHQQVAYTGKTSTTITGCTGGVGTLLTGNPVLSFNVAPTGLTTFWGRLVQCRTDNVEYGYHAKTNSFTAAIHFDSCQALTCQMSLFFESQGGAQAGFGFQFSNCYFAANPAQWNWRLTGTTSPEVGMSEVEWESAGNPITDVPIALYGGYGSSQGEPGLSFLHWGMTASFGHRVLLNGNAQTGNGSNSSTPMAPQEYFGSLTWSFWAKIPSGTVISPGTNTFTYYTAAGTVGFAPAEQLLDLFCNIQVKAPSGGGAPGGITTPISWAIESHYTNPGGLWGSNYVVTFFVTLLYGGASSFTLTSDLVFFLETSQTSPSNNINRIQTGYD